MDELPLPWPEFREVWREIPGFDGRYEISSNGRARSWLKKGGNLNRKSGHLFASTPRIKAAYLGKQGYPMLQAFRPEGKAVSLYPHRLVARLFFGDRPALRVTCHIDGDATNNSVNNLHWGTQSQNGRDRWRHQREREALRPRPGVAFREPGKIVADAVALPWPEDREIWRPIAGMDGYEVSSLGRVRSWRKSSGGSRHIAWHTEPRLRKLTIAGMGYYMTTLPRVSDGVIYPHLVHRLALCAFAGPPPFPKAICRHLDGNPLNCTVNNLAWGTARENGQDRARHGTSRPSNKRYYRGESNARAKLTVEIVREVKRRLAEGERNCDIARDMGIGPERVSSIANGRSWVHVH